MNKITSSFSLLILSLLIILFTYDFSMGQTCCIDIRGNIDNSPDDEIDVSDLVYMIDYQFRDGAAPACFDEADLDGSGVIDISDLVYMVDYQFRNGDAPLACSDVPVTFSDEFDGPAGQLPDAFKWDYDIGTDWGNAQLEYDTDRPINVSLDGNGNLAIIAREEFYLGQPYTSARIVTKGLYEPTFGRVEARIKLPYGQGIWPAFWLLGADIDQVGWPQCGEIDIMEYLGDETNKVYGTIHGPGYSGGGGIGTSYTLPSGGFNEAFHIFAVEWEENEIRWYVDDILYQTLTPADFDPLEWVFDHPFYIILNVAVGGSWPGAPDGTTVFPQTMLIDYVRVYEYPITQSEVFTDNFGSTVEYQAFLGSKLDAVQIDQFNSYSGTQSLTVTVPDVGDPSGSYAGGAFTAGIVRDLSQFNTLSFYAKASMSATLDVVGIGNDNTGTSKYVAEITNLPLTTNWQKFYIPIPLAEKLDAERGLFYFAEGPENGNGYQIWFDEIVFENEVSITNPRPAINSQTIYVEFGETINTDNGFVTFDVNGSDLSVDAMPGYFTYSSSNPLVIEVEADGSFTTTGVGSSNITAALSSINATGSITINVTAPQDAPATSAPIPTANAVDVISLLSDIYTDVTVDAWSTDWDITDVEDYMIGLDLIKKYTNLVYAGIEFVSPTIDATTMTHFHIDVWTPDATISPNLFKIKLVDFGADGNYGGGDDVEHELNFDESIMKTKEWVSLDLPLSSFTSLTTKEHLAQIIISGDLNTVFIDNIYLYQTSGATEPATPAPSPSHVPVDVISLYSDVYTNVPVETFSAPWDVADIADFTIGSDNIKKYTNLTYAGIEFKTPTIDASTMTHFRLDLWTPDNTNAPAVFKIKLVDFGANGVWDADGDDVEHELIFDETVMNSGTWVTFDLLLSDFTGLTTREHLGQLIISGDPNTVFVDNILFHK